MQKFTKQGKLAAQALLEALGKQGWPKPLCYENCSFDDGLVGVILAHDEFMLYAHIKPKTKGGYTITINMENGSGIFFCKPLSKC